MPYLGLLDTSGIQNFLYKSPKLKDIASSSDRIELLTDEKRGLFYRAAHEVEGASVIVAAGGNAALTAQTHEQVEQVFRIISRELLESGDGLEIIGAIHGYENGQLAQQYRKALQGLEHAKLTQPRSTDFKFSGLTESRPRSVPVKPDTDRPYKNKLFEPTDLDDMIAIGSRSKSAGQSASKDNFGLMAVVTVDGLSMGKRLLNWMISKEQSEIPDDRFIQEFRAWSVYTRKRWSDAWSECLNEIDSTFELPDRIMSHPCAAMRDIHLQLHPKSKQGGHYLPCRRIYQGGDDMVFVCDARVAMSLTASLARRLERAIPDTAVPVEFQSIPVSAGVVFVDSHFPFSRAQDLSNMVRGTAKKAAADGRRGASYLSWWLNRQGSLGPRISASSLKPYVLNNIPGVNELSWGMLETLVLSGLWGRFAETRNKLKDILAAADTHNPEDGANAVRTMLAARPLGGGAGFEFLEPRFNAEHGFDIQKRSTPLLDAGELFDFHFPYTMPQDPADINHSEVSQ